MSEGPEIIRHPPTPGNVLFKEPKKCDYCNCTFFNSHDLDRHLDAFGRRPHSVRTEEDYDSMSWHPSRYPDCDKIISVRADEALALAIKQNGQVIIGNWKYTLSQNEKWIKAKQIAGI